ncbi:MAG: hypothetical protein HPY65_18000 [Syntrophaceae bacterium]|nr:hypothetical protein [Syntrophaceae bacterium]
MKELKFTFAYQFIARIASMVDDNKSEEYIEDYFDPSSLEFLDRIALPKKKTLLHTFITEVGCNDWEWIMRHTGEENIEQFRKMCRDAEVDIPSWLNENEFHDHRDDAYELLEIIMERIAEPAFHILFSDHECLFRFQMIVSSVVKKMKKEDNPKIFKKDGVLSRLNYLPKWLTNAVYHRDKGHCQICRRDLTGLLTPMSQHGLHYDHIIPLHQGGTNDPTNFQLTCEKCNTSKKAAISMPKPVTFTYW